MADTPLSSDELKQKLEGMGVNLALPQAVAVSGGPDSLALALLLNEICNVEAVTVDHGLRPEATGEARFVGDVMARRGIAHTILTWEGEKPSSGIPAAARAARYKILADWCEKKSINNLYLAHHMDDQAETFLMRLSRGSGVYGLAAMSAKSPLMGSGGKVELIRPLLEYPKSRMMAALQTLGESWVEDPSNQDLQYDRVKAREYLAGEPLLALDTEKLAKTANRMQRTRKALDHYADAFLRDAVTLYDAGYGELDINALGNPPDEIGLRALSRLVRHISGADYGPRMEKLERAYTSLRGENFQGQTLSGCQLVAMGKSVIIARERAAVDQQPWSGEDIWDGRFELIQTGEGEVKALGEEGWRQLKDEDSTLKNSPIPHICRLTLPALWSQNKIIAQPHLGFGAGLAANFRPNHPLL